MSEEKRTHRRTFWRASATGFAHGFTLIELLITIAIIGVLLAFLLPAARSTVSAARGFKCQMAQRSIAFDFSVFADDSLHGSRGDDERNLPRGSFRLETFIESEYQIDEFWGWGSDDVVNMPDASGNDPMRCPEVKGQLTLRRNIPCHAGAIDPPQNISFGFNVRLYLSDTLDSRGRVRAVVLTSRILEQPNLPLLWDVDGELATLQGQSPIFSGPSLNSPLIFADDRYWYPALRHNHKGNFAFVDGHVADSREPLNESAWQWGYQPPAR